MTRFGLGAVQAVFSLCGIIDGKAFAHLLDLQD
jgi:hypothetical protein